MTEQRFLVTGALGCIGAWTAYHLVKQGRQVVSFDISAQVPVHSARAAC